MLAFQSRSEVRFVVPPGAPPAELHVLVATFAFPERSRWQLEPASGRRGGRRVVYRYGPSVWMLAPDEASSRRLDGAEAEGLVTALELRRAAMLWPDGFEWQGVGLERTATLPGPRTLRAALDPSTGRPTSIESRLADGTVLERLHGLEWQETGGRAWPARFHFEAGDSAIWEERVVAVDPHVRHVDGYFQPHDARSDPRGDPAPPSLVEVPRLALERFELPPGTDWTAAAERFAELRRDRSERLEPLELEDVLRAELHPDGRPAALLLVLSGAAAGPLPEGFRLEPAGTSLALLVAEPELIDAAVLRSLERARPADSAPAGPPRVRLQPSGATGPRAQILLPLAP